jgi:HYDIN/CFA65/VesB-like, Ig-like domain
VDSDSSGPQTVSLTGTGTAPVLTLSATALVMPDTPLNLNCTPRVLTLKNTGTGALTISSITTSNNTVFAISADACPVGAGSLAAGASCQLSVTFHPVATGTVTGSLAIASNAPGSPATVSLTGTGKPPCPLAAAEATERVLRGTDRTTFTVTPSTTCQGKDEMALACVNAQPATCAFNPGTIQNPGESLLTVGNLRAVGGSGKQFEVTGTSADAIQRTLSLQVLFADFSFTAYPTAATVGAGETASYALTLVPVNGLAGQVALSCTGAPAGGSCTVTPSSVEMANDAPVQVQVKVATSSGAGTVPASEPKAPPPGGRILLLVVGGLAGMLLAGELRRKRKLSRVAPRGAAWRRWALGSALLLAVAIGGSCGGGGTAPPVSGSVAGTYTVVVTGTLTPAAGTTMVTDSSAPALKRQATLKLTVK